MLDAVVAYLPSPVDIPPSRASSITIRTKDIERPAEDKAPFSALVFKIMTDPFVGQLCFRPRLLGPAGFGRNRTERDQGRGNASGGWSRCTPTSARRSGDPRRRHLRRVGLKTAATGDTICADKAPIVLESIDFPAPVIQLAIEPKTKADQEKLGVAINKLVNEDPTLKVSTDPETGQTILAGMGELHLEIIVDRMKREFNVEANVGKPQVAYRETIRNTAEVRVHAQEADRRPRSVRESEAAGRAASGQGVRVRQRDSRRLRFRRNSSRRWKRAWPNRSKAACWRAIRCRT